MPTEVRTYTLDIGERVNGALTLLVFAVAVAFGFVTVWLFCGEPDIQDALVDRISREPQAPVVQIGGFRDE